MNMYGARRQNNKIKSMTDRADPGRVSVGVLKNAKTMGFRKSSGPVCFFTGKFLSLWRDVDNGRSLSRSSFRFSGVEFFFFF